MRNNDPWLRVDATQNLASSLPLCSSSHHPGGFDGYCPKVACSYRNHQHACRPKKCILIITHDPVYTPCSRLWLMPLRIRIESREDLITCTTSAKVMRLTFWCLPTGNFDRYFCGICVTIILSRLERQKFGFDSVPTVRRKENVPRRSRW